MHGLEALTFTPHLGSQLPVAGRGPDQNSPRRQLPAKYFAEDGVRPLLSIISTCFWVNFLITFVGYHYGEYPSYQGKLPQGT